MSADNVGCHLCRPTLWAAADNVGCSFGRQPSAKNLEKIKYLSLRRIFVEYKNEEKTRISAKKWLLLLSLTCSLAEKNLRKRNRPCWIGRMDSTTSNDKDEKFHDKCQRLLRKRQKNNKLKVSFVGRHRVISLFGLVLRSAESLSELTGLKE